MSFHTSETHRLDVLIIGGGVAGLWLLDRLCRSGYDALLVEKTALGSGQTVASQGILHGGLKHALTGRLGAHVDALKEMPVEWRACLGGLHSPDLSHVRMRSQFLHCWHTGSILGWMGMMGARIGLRVSMEAVPRRHLPIPLQACSSTVYRLDEQVIDPASLVVELANLHATRIIRGTVCSMSRPLTRIDTVTIRDSEGDATLVLQPETVVFTAGEGNDALRAMCGLKSGAMQRLPLRYLAVSGDLPDMNGFCMSGTKAKAIVTTHRTAQDHAVWQVASELVGDCPSDVFEGRVMTQLGESLPAFPWPEVSVRVINAVRAEAVMPDGSRASDIQLLREGNAITAWPTKLVLAPRLAERIRVSLPEPVRASSIIPVVENWPRPTVAPYPWTE